VLRIWLMIALTIAVLAACSTAATPTMSPQATVTPIPVYEYIAPTAPPQLATLAAQTATVPTGDDGLDPERVERGRDRYVALECASCHGENGEGLEEGTALIGFAQSEDEFVSFMRSGGTMGAEHQYSTNRLSDTGGRNLYQYLLSLSAPS
jgi:mono/diheme cytochrome c family protein